MSRIRRPQTDLRLRWLRKNFPSHFRVGVYFSDRKNIIGQSDGYTQETEKGFSVKLASDLDDAMQAETLIHEWAHVRIMHIADAREQEDPHHPLWQLEYGRIHSAWERFKENHGS